MTPETTPDKPLNLKDLEPKKSKKGLFREYTEAIFIAVIIALILRAFVIEAFKIPSGSMIPTLKIGDHIFVNKFIYGLRIPFTKIRFFDVRKPQKGEIIVFIYPGDKSKDFIKRVVGTPGDKVEIKGRLLYINDVPVKRYETDDRDALLADFDFRDSYNLLYEELNNKKYHVLYHKLRSQDDYGPRVVPDNHLFVMGDNRDNSSDSRLWPFGPFVPMDNIKGKALVVWLSLDLEHRYPYIRLPRIRWERFGHVIH